MNNLKVMSDQFSPLLVFKNCPGCGSSSFSPDSEKSLKCTDCGFRYFINMSAAVAALIYDSQDRLLLTVRAHDPAKGKLDLPGGFVDLGETAEQALEREIKEELNLELVETVFFGSFPNQYLYAGVTYHTLDLVFTCLVKDLDSIVVADDVSGFTFIHPDLVDIEMIGLDSVKRIILSLRR